MLKKIFCEIIEIEFFLCLTPPMYICYAFPYLHTFLIAIFVSIHLH